MTGMSWGTFASGATRALRRSKTRAFIGLGAVGRSSRGMSQIYRSGRRRAVVGGVGAAAIWGRSAGSRGLTGKSSGGTGALPTQDPYGDPTMM